MFNNFFFLKKDEIDKLVTNSNQGDPGIYYENT